MLSNAVQNQFSARAEALTARLAQATLEHQPRILPFEEHERWLARRSEVLHLQLSLLDRAIEASCDEATLDGHYQSGLMALDQQFRDRHREMMQARVPDNRQARIVAEDGSGFVPLDHEEIGRRMQRFGQRIDQEMELYRRHSFGPREHWAHRRADKRYEWEAIEQQLDNLKERINSMNLPLVEAAAAIAEQRRALERERRDAMHDAAFHQNWLQACEAGDLAMVLGVLDQVLRDARGQSFLDRLGPAGMNAFHLACQNQDIAVADVLRQAGVTMTAPTDHGRSAFHVAARFDHGERTRTFLDWLTTVGVDKTARDPSNRSPLNEAVFYGNLTAVGWLVEQGLPLDERDCHQRTPLHVAAAQGHGSVVRWLLANGADMEARNAAGERPIFEACLGGRVGAMQAFLEAGQWLRADELAELQRRRVLGADTVRRACTVPLTNWIEDFNAVASPAQHRAPAAARPAPVNTSPPNPLQRWFSALRR